jgi:hypothetical protein
MVRNDRTMCRLTQFESDGFYAPFKNGRSVEGMDFDHRTNRFVSVATNRGNRGEGTKKEGNKNYKVKRRNG